LSEVVVAVHQPNFIPWIGYFHKGFGSKIFILLDDVPYSKNNYQNRSRVYGSGDPAWLTVPVLTKSKFGQRTDEVQINLHPRGLSKQIKTLQARYGKAPFFNEIWELIGPSFESPGEFLSPFCIGLIERIWTYLDIPAELMKASDLEASEHGGDHLIELLDKVGGDVYLSGSGGKKYLEPEKFTARGKSIRYNKFTHPVYEQSGKPFEPGLSIVDLLFNHGPESREIIVSS